MHDARRGARQTAYQVLVASTPEKLAADQGDLWDSGQVASDQSTQIVYAGKPLASRMQCYWKVRLWDADGKPTAYSKPALWTHGPAEAGGRQGQVDRPRRADDLSADRQSSRASLTFDGCAWVWCRRAGRQRRRKRARQGTRFFRSTVTIPAGKTIRRARFLIDGRRQLRVVRQREAGRSAATAGNAPQMADVTKQLARRQEHAWPSWPRTAAVPVRPDWSASSSIEFDEGEPIVEIDRHVVEVGRRRQRPNWNAAEFDDSKWPAGRADRQDGRRAVGRCAGDQRASIVLRLPAVPQGVRGARARSAARRVYASALGVYRLHINGQPVGNDYFTPDWTDYNKRVYYNTYDVTDLVQANGPNAIGGVLAAGWYAGADRLEEAAATSTATEPRLFAQLEIELADGTVQTVATDGTWKTAFGPYIEGEFLAGETYDATQGDPRLGLARASTTPPGSRWPSTESIPAKLQAFPGVTVQETGVLQAGEDHRAEAGRLRLRPGPELRRLRPAEGPAGRPARRSCSASPRCSIPTARSTRPISAAPGRPIPTSSRATAKRSGSRGSPSTASATSK